jgi:S-formylglutathione hydrolase FrmB
VSAPSSMALLPLAIASFIAVGAVGGYNYVLNYWLYRGFSRPHDPAYVRTRGTPLTITVASAALGGRRQEVDVYLPPGYASHPDRRYPVLYLLHGEPGRPAAFLSTVRMGVVEDELVALHRARPLILVMPFGSTGSFTDKEWANGVGKHAGWETFVARDVVRTIDDDFRTIRAGWARGIGGLSEGGYGAINIAIHHPGEFGLVESWSGYELADPIDLRSRPCCPAP